MRAATNPETFIADNGRLLIFMGIVAAILRPAVSFVHDLVKHQMIGGAFTTLIRWQSHVYVLPRSMSLPAGEIERDALRPGGFRFRSYYLAELPT